ncbi:MAG: pentapeptide repeat-containing protein [Methylophilaceae bacterium]
MHVLKNTIAALFLLSASTAFAGEFGDYCTASLANGKTHKTQCLITSLYEGKTYCFGSEEGKDAFLENPKEVIAKAAASYAKLAEPERTKISQADALAQINSKSCDLSNKDLGYLIFNGMDLSHCNMQNISFFGAELKGAKLVGANLQGAYLNLARIENADFSKANLSNATIFQPIFDKTIFRGANLSNARVIGTLGKVDMSGIDARKGRFGLDVGNQPMGQMKFDSVGGNFAGANFEGADLNIAAFTFGDLSGANLRHTNLYRADLNSANLTGADLTGADLTNAEVDAANFKDVKGLETVKGFASVKGKCNHCETTTASIKPAAGLDSVSSKQAKIEVLTQH